MIDHDVEGEPVTCGCHGPCEHAPVLSEVVIPASRPRSVRMRALDRRGLVEMAYGRGIAPIIELAARRECGPAPVLIEEDPAVR